MKERGFSVRDLFTLWYKEGQFLVRDLFTLWCNVGSGDGSVVEHWTHDWNVVGSSPSRSSGRILFSRVNFLCWPLFQYPLHPCVTAIAHRRPWSSCQKCRWKVTAKHICTLCMWLQIKRHCKLVQGCMVYTEFTPRQQQFHMATACNNQTAL